MAQHNELGRKGEQMAVAYLKDKGYEIKSINYRHQYLEIDVVAEYNNELVIVEVKTRNSEYLTDPTELISRKKQADIIRAANHYIEEHEVDLEVRFDVVIIVLNDNQKKIEHIEDAFYPQV